MKKFHKKIMNILYLFFSYKIYACDGKKSQSKVYPSDKMVVRMDNLEKHNFLLF